jgi:hypothetical protein
MKTVRSVFPMAVLSLAMLVFASCESNPEVESQEDLLPPQFTVDIPEAISKADAGGRISTGGRIAHDSLMGNEVYRHLRTFIAVGRGASRIVEGFIHGIRKHHINRVLTLSFVSEDDSRVKNLVVTQDSEFEGNVWDYQLTVTDADSETAADGGKALQIFWNKQEKVNGIAIIKPYNCDRTKNDVSPDAMFRIDYNEEGIGGYDAQMEVSISGLPLADASLEPFSMGTLHMFAARKGDFVDVFGNSNHPNAVLFNESGGFNWAFVASSDRKQDIGVAEVGLPPSTLDSDSRDLILKDYSVKNVLTNEITQAWPGIDPALLNSYLANTAAPGYFENRGFISGGVSPGAAWDVLTERIGNLSPYNPKQTSNLRVEFK